MRRVELKGIRNFVCQGTNLDVRPGELLVLLGPNGAGKTTLLNVIAGLTPYEGTVLFDKVAVDGHPARDRQVGYVFQDLLLFPHLNVFENIAYGLHNTLLSQAERDERVGHLLDLLAICHLKERYPGPLSGGEKQRVALARALAAQPQILLLDEPFSSLDSRTSAFLRSELKHLQKDLGTTTVFVTHDLAEAEQVADRIAIVQDGQIEQIGTADQVLFSPPSGQASALLGSPNILECTASRDLGHGLAQVDWAGLEILVPCTELPIQRIHIFPRDVSISVTRPGTELNVFQGTVSETSQANGDCLVQVDLAGQLISARQPRRILHDHKLRQGSQVYVELGLMKLRVGPAVKE